MSKAQIRALTLAISVLNDASQRLACGDLSAQDLAAKMRAIIRNLNAPAGITRKGTA